jgi:hypothetical protein
MADEENVRRGIHEDDALLAVCSPPFAALYRLWESKRAGRTYPARGDFDPIELKDWLGRITLIDVLHETPMDFRYRLCGSRTVDQYGLDLTGRRLSEACFIGTPATAQKAMTELVRIGRVRYRNDPVEDVRGFASMRERLYLPLAEDGTTINMLLCYQESRILVHPQNRVR